MRIVAIRIDVRSSLGTTFYEARLGDGLNVLNAKNSWGKSTLLQGITYALGLEGALSASRRSPFGPAMLQAIDTEHGRGAVSESFVTLTVMNGQGRYLRVRRWACSQDVEKTLVHVWLADSESELESARRQDMFVREPGAAARDLGFHRLLEDFLNWDLPLVPDFNGGETKLYLEVVYPLFYIEQKFGWSGVAPRVPTHYRIREPLRRAVEYVLGLSTLERLKAREALREEETAIRRDWTASVAHAEETAAAESLRVALLSLEPVGTAQRRPALLEAFMEEGWLSLEVVEARWRERRAALSGQTSSAGERTIRSRADLAASESEVRRTTAMTRDFHEQLTFARADLDALASRLASVENDKQRLKDIQRIRTLGGELELPLVAEGRCPTCQQDIDSRDVATHSVSSVEDNVILLEAERITLLAMRTSAEERLVALTRACDASESMLREARDRVRLLRDELVGPSNTPSVAEVQEKLTLDTRLRGADRARAVLGSVDDDLDSYAVRLDDVRARRAALEADSMGPEDVAILRSFRSSFTSQLSAYGLRSLPPEEVTIDDRTLLPVNDGFELSFDVGMGMSASDTIRTKWAYHTALFETARKQESSRHIGFLILDEPRQQETDRSSLAAFLQRLKDDRHMGQVIYATSEEPAMLRQLLRGIPYTVLPADGAHLIGFRSSAPSA